MNLFMILQFGRVRRVSSARASAGAGTSVSKMAHTAAKLALAGGWRSPSPTLQAPPRAARALTRYGSFPPLPGCGFCTTAELASVSLLMARHQCPKDMLLVLESHLELSSLGYLSNSPRTAVSLLSPKDKSWQS